MLILYHEIRLSVYFTEVNNLLFYFVSHDFYFCLFTVIAEANTHDAFSIGCVVAGLGFGALSSCWEIAAQDFVGAHKWTKIHSTLETLSAICAASFVFGLSFLVPLEDSGDKHFIFILGLALSTVSVIWLIIAVVSIYVAKMRSFRLKQNWLL